MTTTSRLLALLAVAVCLPDIPHAMAEGRILAYDGFRATGEGSTYAPHRPLAHSKAPTAGTVGFDPDSPWRGLTNHLVGRDAETRELTHPLVPGTQPGAIGQITFFRHKSIRRDLTTPPVATSGVYTLALLIRAHDLQLRRNRLIRDGHTTNLEDAHAMLGFTPVNPGQGTESRDGDGGKRGLSLGYDEDTLAVFAGGKVFPILSEYNLDTTYLLIAEMTVDPDGPEYVRGFYAAESDTELTPAPFNVTNNGRGAAVETWSSPEDMAELEFYLGDRPGTIHASPNDRDRTDLVTWDEVRLIDGAVSLPLPGERPEDLIDGLPSLPRDGPKMVAYWPFDEREGDTAKDAFGHFHATLKQAKFTTEAARGSSALRFDARIGGNGSDFAEVPHRVARDHGLIFQRGDAFSISAWVRGDGKGAFKEFNDILTKANSGRSTTASFRDIKGVAFRISQGKLQLDMINSINSPQKDDKLVVAGLRDVPDDGQYHHVVVSYDGSSRSAGVRFFINGEEDSGRSLDSEREGHALTRPVDVIAPLCIGGRNGDHRDRFRFGFTGCIDEVAVFNYALTEAEAAAISRVPSSELGYDLTQLDALFRLRRAGKGNLTIAGLNWTPIGPGGLGDEPGEPIHSGRNWAIRLGDDGSGLMTR